MYLLGRMKLRRGCKPPNKAIVERRTNLRNKTDGRLTLTNINGKERQQQTIYKEFLVDGVNAADQNEAAAPSN